MESSWDGLTEAENKFSIFVMLITLQKDKVCKENVNLIIYFKSPTWCLEGKNFALNQG
jgi:hypothetical protein